ncbi:hypothetical protein FF1_027116 [Malus domestica]
MGSKSWREIDTNGTSIIATSSSGRGEVSRHHNIQLFGKLVLGRRLSKRRIMSSDSEPSPDSSSSSTPTPDSSKSSPSGPSPKESPEDSSSAPPPSSTPASSPPPSSPPPSSSPPPKDSSSSSSPPPKDSSSSSSPPPKDSSSSSSPHPPKQGSQSPPAPKEATPSPPHAKESPGKATPAQQTPAADAEDETLSAPPPPGRSRTSPSGALTPPRASSSSSKSSSDDDDTSSSSNKGRAAGVAIGAAVIIIVLLVVCVVCIRKRRRKRRDMQYYGDAPKAGGGYYNTQQQSWHDMNNPQGDHVMRLNNQPPGGGGGAWSSTPPQMPMSGEVSTNYSAPPLPPPSPSMALGFNKSTFTYDELAAATNGFDQANLLGQGGFGYVHKGVLPNGTIIAVKSLKSGSGQGEREFAAEVEIISRVHHRHLVSLVGYCIVGEQRMLVYEFVPNKTMEYHLHGKGLPPMDWPTRLRIAVGSAKGLAYLHEDCHPKIIHRDIKSANILIDNNFEAMVADFGLAKLSSDNNTHVSTRVMGTFGYLAPEYASSGKLTEKSDVFSFGVMLLELITGKKPVDPSNAMDDSLVDWARPLLTRALEDNNYAELVDIRLDNNYNPNEMARMVACAAASIRHSARKRAKMSQIVRALEGDVSLDDLNEGTKPGKSSMFNASGGSSDYDTQAYNADMKKFRKLALSSQEFGSSEFGTSSNDSREMSTPKK